MKLKNVALVLVIILIIFITGLTLYKFKNEDSKENDELIFNVYEAINFKKNLIYSDTLDKETYKDYIITDELKSVDYEFYNDEKSILGNIYIDENQNLHITDSNSNDDRIISNVKFRTMKLLDDKTYNDIYIYLISTSNELYYMFLGSNNIRDAKVTKISIKRPVLNFSNVSYHLDLEPSVNTLFVLCDDGNLYEVASKLRYDEKIKLLFDNIMVYEDGTIGNVYGRMFEDSNGNYYKIKYIFYVKKSPTFMGEDVVLIVTDDNKVMVSLPAEIYSRIHVLNLKLKDIEFGMKYPFVNGKLNLIFENDVKMEMDAYCSAYYCVNEIE